MLVIERPEAPLEHIAEQSLFAAPVVAECSEVDCRPGGNCTDGCSIVAMSGEELLGCIQEPRARPVGEAGGACPPLFRRHLRFSVLPYGTAILLRQTTVFRPARTGAPPGSSPASGQRAGLRLRRGREPESVRGRTRVI